MNCKRVKVVFLTLLGVGVLSSFSFAEKKIYDSKCGSCHGKDGKGNPAMAKVFKVAPAALNLVDEETLAKKDEDILKVIAEGKNKMPAYGKQLKAEEQKSVLQYMRGLAEKKEEKK